MIVAQPCNLRLYGGMGAVKPISQGPVGNFERAVCCISELGTERSRRRLVCEVLHLGLLAVSGVAIVHVLQMMNPWRGRLVVLIDVRNNPRITWTYAPDQFLCPAKNKIGFLADRELPL